MGLGSRHRSDAPLLRRSLLGLQEEEYVVGFLPKPFENPKIIHIFARFLTESALFYRKSLKASTINNV